MEILLSKNETKKDEKVSVLKDCYDKNLYVFPDLKEISRNTDKKITINKLLIREEIVNL